MEQRQAGRTCHGRHTADLSTILVDGPRIQQVFSNLLGNAVKHTPRGGTVRTRAQGGRIWIESRIGEGSTFSFAIPRSGPG